MTATTIEETQPRFDLLLQGGRVIDPANGRYGRLDVAIAGKVIAEVAPGIPASAAAQVVDVSGLIVTPGIVDMHTHCYMRYPTPPGGYVDNLHADHHMLASGVTTTVDAGTAGWRNFFDFKTGKTSSLNTLSKPLITGLAISPDGRNLLFNQVDQQSSEILLMENFR